MKAFQCLGWTMLLLTAGSATTAHGLAQPKPLVGTPRANHDHRERSLVFAVGNERLCDEVTLKGLRMFWPNADDCLINDIQWDPDGILMGKLVYFDSNDPLAIQRYKGIYSAVYTPSRGSCQFDYCLLVSTAEMLVGQYTYDCSGVYCGENAKRDCNGNYEAKACAGGASSALPEIPTLAQGFCERVLDAYPDDADNCIRTASSCVAAAGDAAATGYDPPPWKWSCRPRCLQCNGDGSCSLRAASAFYFYDIGTYGIRSCLVDAATDEETLCWQRTFGRLKLVTTNLLVHESFGCVASLNGRQCRSCTPCDGTPDVLQDGQDFQIKADCSNLASGGTFNTCNDKISGTEGLAYVNNLIDGDTSCTSGGAIDLSPKAPKSGNPQQRNDGPTPPSAGAVSHVSFGLASGGVILLMVALVVF